jgi:hypothetical protein
MKILKITIFSALISFSSIILAQNTKAVKLIFSARIRSVETLGKKLNNSNAFLYENNVLIDSIYSEKGKIKFKIEGRNIYKIIFSKNGYIDKFVIINSLEIPVKKKITDKIKADINLFKSENKIDYIFLDTTPVSIASYNFVKKKILWDFEYNRIIVEKLIGVSVKEIK